METILKVKNLNVQLDGEQILANLSFEVKEKETLVILGPNGAGKTVLLKALLGLLPYQGEVQWRSGVKIGYVPQRLPFIKDFPLSVREFFELKKVPTKEISSVLEAVGITEKKFLERRVGELSSGQFQRILVAWGLTGGSEVLLFDEPTAGIDIGGQETIYTLLEKLTKERGLTVLLVTHDLSIVYRQANNVLCLNPVKSFASKGVNKNLLCYGPAKEILTPQTLSRLFGGEIKFYPHTHN